MTLCMVLVLAAETSNCRDWRWKDPISHFNGFGGVQNGEFHVPDTSTSDCAQ